MANTNIIPIDINPEKIKDAFINSIKDFKESTSVVLITTITFVIILIAFIFYFYYTSLRSKNCSLMDSVYGNLNGKIKSIDNSEQFNYTFKDYYVKTAYNCCSGGNYKNSYVDLCSLKDLLKQGVRGLDFEIYSINNNPVISTSTSNSYFIKETFNYINFMEAMNVIRDYAFSTSNAPNSLDPIIIHLRIKSANQDMYKNFAKILER